MEEFIPLSEEWVDFDERSPEVGQVIRVFKGIEFEGKWNGEIVRKCPGHPNILGTIKSYWKILNDEDL